MKKLKLAILLLSILCFILLLIVFLLLNENKKRFNLDEYNNLLNTMSSNIKDEMFNDYLGGEIVKGFWADEVDSFYFYLDKMQNTNSYSDYSDILYFVDITKKEKIIKILSSLDVKSNKEKEFAISFLEYLSLQEILLKRLKSYYPFDRLAIYSKAISLKGDTIKYGDEYIGMTPIIVCNSEYKHSLVLDGDTIPFSDVLNTFSILAKKRGQIRKEGYITYFYSGEEKRMPIYVDFFVK